MEKKTDALKAINEYLRKPGISELGRANLLKTYAWILLSRKKEDMDSILKAIKLFKDAGKLFFSIGCNKGLGLCKFALAKIHNEFMPELSKLYPGKNEDSLTEISTNFNQNALKIFRQIKFWRGELYAEKLDDHLKKKMHQKTFKSTRYYIDLAKQANKQDADLKPNSWISDEVAVLLGILSVTNSPFL